MRQDTPNNLPNERPTLAAPAAILIVNGGVDPPGGSWIELCLSQLTRTTPKGSYQVYVWNNNLGERGFYKSIQTQSVSIFLASLSTVTYGGIPSTGDCVLSGVWRDL